MSTDRSVWPVSRSYEDLCARAKDRGYQVLLFTSPEVVDKGGRILERGQITTLAVGPDPQTIFARFHFSSDDTLADAADALLRRI